MIAGAKPTIPQKIQIPPMAPNVSSTARYSGEDWSRNAKNTTATFVSSIDNRNGATHVGRISTTVPPVFAPARPLESVVPPPPAATARGPAPPGTSARAATTTRAAAAHQSAGPLSLSAPCAAAPPTSIDPTAPLAAAAHTGGFDRR